jgi:S1-C subfamily serine protease
MSRLRPSASRENSRHSRPWRIGRRALSRPTLALLGLLGTALGQTARAQEVPATTPPPALDIGKQIRGVFDKCQSAVARIEASDAHGKLSGTGFFIDPNGTLYTSYSVGGESHDITVITGTCRQSARRLVGDLRSGIAILKVEAETPFLSFGKSKDLGVGSPVMTVGYPYDLPASPSFGVVGGFDIKYLNRYFATTHIRANLPVQSGQGGAPLLDLNGNVVGILISSLNQGSGSFALPIEAAEKVRRDFLRFHQVHRGWLGLAVRPNDPPVNGSTALVSEVLSNSPAQKAGVLPGDTLLGIGDRTVASPADVLDGSFFLTADDLSTLRVWREGEQIDLSVQPTKPPEEKLPIERFAPAFEHGADVPAPASSGQ